MARFFITVENISSTCYKRINNDIKKHDTTVLQSGDWRQYLETLGVYLIVLIAGMTMELLKNLS